ncbi:MAG: hypothetical protein ACXVMI_05445 [Flavisolibacter sp.]
MTQSSISSSATNSLKLFLSGLIFLFFPILLITIRVLHHTNGVYIYPYDDTFIHLTIADHLLKGNWGINPNQFASASSSVLYTLILAFFRIFSRNVMVPFLVNCLGGVTALIAVHFWLKKHLVSYLAQGAIFFFVVFFTPLPLLVISGMEHTLQCLFSFLFIFYFCDWLEESKNQGGKLPLKILLFSMLVTTIRYEGLFLIAVAVALLVIQRRIRQAFVLGFVATFPLIVFGWISVSKGNYFLPNSVLVKSGSFNYSSPLRFIYDILFNKLVYAQNGMAALATQRLMIILPLLYLLFKNYLRPSYRFIFIFLFGGTVLQLSFASTGYLYRYEAYLFFCFTIIAAVIVYKFGRPMMAHLSSVVAKCAALALAFFLLVPVILRSLTALEKAPQACINIYEQQYQMARFTKQYFNQATVGLNDIGAVGYFTNSRIIDLWGLASIEVTKSKKDHFWTANFLDSLCRRNHVQMAIIYDSWFSDSLRKRWSKAATWQIQKNVVCGDSIVSFYSVDTTSGMVLKEQLKAFESQLPPSVIVRYY